jgi:integrase
MARLNIKYQLKQELGKMESYGESKYLDKLKTKQERDNLMANGATYRESLAINYSKDKIYSYSTMSTYQKEVSRFGDWLISNGNKKITLEQAKSFIQPYVNYQISRGLTPDSINTTLAAICKATHTNIYDYDKPQRSVANIVRGTGVRQHDERNERVAAKLLNANRLLGLRRSELKRLKAKDIQIKDDKVIVKSIGKGGKKNEQIFIHQDEKERVLALKHGLSEDDYIFDRQLFRNDADLHHQRELRAKDLYQRICDDMQNNPCKRAEYQQMIKEIFKQHKKALRENLNAPYIVRGANRQRL